MSGDLDAKARKALSKVGGINLGIYGILFSLFAPVCLWIFNLFGIPRATYQPFVIVLNLPGLLLIILHIFLISRSLGVAALRAKNTSLRESARNLLGGAILALATVVLLTVIYFYLDLDRYGAFLQIGPSISVGVLSLYLFLQNKMVAHLWLWVIEYTHRHPKEAGAFDLVKKHPKSRLIEPTFKAVFGEGETRSKAGAKLAFMATYGIRPRDEEKEEDEDDEENVEEEQVKLIAEEIAPGKVPLRARNITDGKCPNCSAPVPSPAPRYCSRCGESFGETW